MAEMQVKIERRFGFPTCGVRGAVRGTEFLITIKDDNESSVIVLEGSIELNDLQGKKKVTVNIGYEATVSKQSVISESQKINFSKIERW